jgi:hypothetical protein
MSPRFNLEDYVDVNTRIDTFWERFPEGRIVTRLLSDPNTLDRVVVEASVYRSSDTDALVAATGLAFEIEGGSGANATSHLENCETSAIGRALANLGLETSKGRPSRQEMDKVNRFSPPVALSTSGTPGTGLSRIFKEAGV